MDSQVWQLCLQLRDIVELICAPKINHNQVAYLKVMIEEYVCLRGATFPLHPLKPKHHYLLHCPDLILHFGPLSRLWTLRFESKHSYFKECARKLHNFIHLCKTLAKRHQLLQSYLCSGQLFTPTIQAVGEANVYDENLYNDLIQKALSTIPLPVLSSFECLAFKCKPPLSLTFLLIYCPLKPNPAFLQEFQDLLGTLCTTSANVMILGDLNIHVDTPLCHFAAEFLHLLDYLNLQQHFDAPTDSRGHTLDLVITNSVPIMNLQVHDLGLSDHKAVVMELPFSLSPYSKSKRQIRFTAMKNIDSDALASDLRCVSSGSTALSSVTETVTEDLYGHLFTLSPLAYREHQTVYAKSLKDAQSQFYSNVINSNPGISKQLFSTISHLLKPYTSSHLDATCF
ncbi:hypothetical protein ABVT39_000457 [Epinephelus coioides]